MFRSRLSTCAVSASLCLGILSCGGTPPGARRAQQLLNAGDFEGADRAASSELARFPKHPTLWRIKIRAAMGSGDNGSATAYYREWREMRGADDHSMLRMMANTAVWQGLHAPSALANAHAIQLVERLELHRFTRDVEEKVLHDNDRVAAAASVAVLRAYPPAPRVATDLLGSEDAWARRVVVEGIARKIGAKARVDLLPMLADDDAGVRGAAVRAVSAMANADDTARLTKIARSDSDGSVRANALSALARGPRDGSASVARAALKDAYLGARLAALALLHEREPRAPEIASAAAGSDLFLALRAAVLLPRGGAAGDIALLKRALAGPAWNLRAAAVNAARGIAGKVEGVRIVRPLVADARLEVRLAVARMLIDSGDKATALPILLDALQSDRDGPRLTAAKELARLGDSRGPDALSHMCKAPAPSTRRGAVSAHTAARIITDGLVAALADESATIRIDAAEALLRVARD